eukprot:15364047-Alexandrium_andersonii.AAC.1
MCIRDSPGEAPGAKRDCLLHENVFFPYLPQQALCATCERRCRGEGGDLSLIHISEPTRLALI